MPGINIHLAAVEEYLKLHPLERRNDFILGSIAPDLTDTDETHHPLPGFETNAYTFLVGKVNLKECLPDFDISTSFGKGYFFHLITDYEFYTGMAAGKEDLYRNTDYREFKAKLYHDYESLNDKKKKKYNIKFPEAVKEWNISSLDVPLIIDINYVEKLISRLAHVDLLQYKNSVEQ